MPKTVKRRKNKLAGRYRNRWPDEAEISGRMIPKWVANESGAGVTRIGLDYDLPIANAILTTENMEQAVARQTEKGADAARVAVEMALLVNQLAIPEDELDNLLNGEQ